MKSARDRVPLEQILKSLGDPVRLSIVRQLLEAGNHEIACGCFDYGVAKATFSHHMAVLEEAGIVQARTDGTRRMMSLKLDEMNQKFPGLLALVASHA